MKTWIGVGLMAFVCSACLGSAWVQSAPTSADGSAVPVFTKDQPPATPKLDELPLKESVSQYGITWTFEKPARVGQFVNGDWYVVGPGACPFFRASTNEAAACVCGRPDTLVRHESASAGRTRPVELIRVASEGEYADRQECLSYRDWCRAVPALPHAWNSPENRARPRPRHRRQD